jgi:hypothetical protein
MQWGMEIIDPARLAARRIGDVHGHTILMLAAVGLVAAFIPIVVGVTWLQRRGRLGDPSRLVSFRTYGPILAAALSGGAAAVHVGLIAEHAGLTASIGPTAGVAATGALTGATAFLCSIGAGSTHYAGVDASIAGLLPIGVLSLGVAPVHVALSLPRLWRRVGGAIVGAGVTVVALVVGVAPRLLGLGDATTVAGASAPTGLGYADVLSVVLEAALLGVVALLVLGRPQRLLARLEVRTSDAWVGTALGVAAVAIFSAVAILAGHAVH